MTATLVYSNIKDVTKAFDINCISNRMNNTEEQSTASLLYESVESGGYVDDSFSNRVRTEGHNTCYSSLSINKSWSNLCTVIVESLTRNPCLSVYKTDLMLESG